ncbi:uncharacterized protein M421DRAFT_422737 [Didymella exigua CBS 183.55]|uniref:Uncharacterized protein n=1 Tax=Didymella exigua CBS 183.55 TaxID=1150837 RepID=A0A6A5RFB2_9PLEO|nr:uncharacterized protein M421DRAFT_422737 [Didymella exigua CBS 183.55]KAF1926402.1 hypothetical protein M421DRAFT_422737 [Didymella exigua CBS 183.55]
MGPQQDRDGNIDAIDLTLSSPEPEARPQTQANRHLQQQQPARTVKQEPRNSYRSTHSDSQRQGSTRASQQQPRRINPNHVKQIIETSSSKALRSIVLQLCESSPALSGAIARGLAPQSSWAQALMRGQQAHPYAQPQSQAPIKSEPRSNEQDVYERMKQRLGSSSGAHSSNARLNTQTTASRLCTRRPTAIHENSNGLRLPPSSQGPPTVKREYQISPADSDDSTNIVDFPAMEREARKQEHRHHTNAGSSSRHQTSASQSAEGLAVRQRSTHHHASDHKPKLCVQCGELFNEVDTNCEHHPGRQAPARPGDVSQYTCCGMFEGEPGCKLGRHVSERTGGMTNLKRPSPSLFGSSHLIKKPRVM